MVSIQINNNRVEKGSGGTSRQNQEEPAGRTRYQRYPKFKTSGDSGLEQEPRRAAGPGPQSGKSSVP